MATSPDILRFFLDQVAGEMTIATRPMFGEYCLYHQGNVIGLMCDDMLFLKTTPDLLIALPEIALAPPYPNAKNYFKILPDEWENRPWLVSILQRVALALPPTKPKKSHKKSK